MSIIFEDGDFCAINKPPDVPVDGEHPVTVERILFPRVLKLVHQLDSPTSGVLLLAKHRKAAASAAKQFELRGTSKFYLAVVAGDCQPQVIRAPIEDDDLDERQFRMRIGGKKDAETVVFHVAYNEECSCTLVLLRPATGRRHQLRVHLLSIGNPILGDKTYNPSDTHTARLMLHALFLRNSAVPVDLWAGAEQSFYNPFPGTGDEVVRGLVRQQLAGQDGMPSISP